VVFVLAGLALSVLFVRETIHHVTLEAESPRAFDAGAALTQREVFQRGTYSDPDLSASARRGS
jgi:hypothetical protein